MPSPRLLAALLGVLFLLDADPAAAQFPNRAGGYSNPAAGGRPTFSPYLNLLRRGSPTLNYYGLVRPQQEFRRGQYQLGNEIRGVQREVQRSGLTASTSSLTPSGHASYFMRDLRGTPELFRIGIDERESLRAGLPPVQGSGIGPSGHRAMFGNPAGYYPQR